LAGKLDRAERIIQDMPGDHAYARLTIVLPDAAVRLTGKFQAAVYRATGGRLWGRFAHGPVMLLTTTGRRSGQRRTTTVLYLADGERLIAIGSNTGSDSPPAWGLNLLTNPDAEVQIGRDRRQVRARVAEGEERVELERRMNDLYAGFKDYRLRTARPLKVFVFEPHSGPPI
jgi:deazaflavin-dependent oxidoreductase (nitroreductase family)